MIFLNKKVFLTALSSVFFSSASYAMNPDENRDLDHHHLPSHSVSARMIEAVEKIKQRIIPDLLNEEKLRISQYPYGVDVYGRHPGDKNYGAFDSDELIELLKSNGAQDITWGVANFETMSPHEIEKYIRSIHGAIGFGTMSPHEIEEYIRSIHGAIALT